MVAMVQTPADLPSAPQAAPASPAPTQIRSDIAVIREAHAADNVDKITKAAPVKTAKEKAKDDADTTKPNPVARRAERMAMLDARSEEHTSELQSLMRISYAVFCLKKKKKTKT